MKKLFLNIGIAALCLASSFAADLPQSIDGAQRNKLQDYINSRGSGGSSLPSYTGNALKFLQVNAGETDIAWITIGGGGDALVANPLSQFAATTSLQFKGVISDETGSGAVVFANTPTLVTPVLGVATATSINGLGISTTTGTLTLTNGKTLSASNTLTLTGTDGSSVAFGAGGTVAYIANKLSVFAATTSAELAGVVSDETGSNKLVYSDSPTLVTPTLGVASATSVALSSGQLTYSTSSTAYTATNTIDFSAACLQSITNVTGNVVLATSNLAAGRSVAINLQGGLADRTVSFPTGWRWLNTAPTTLSSNKWMWITATSVSTTDASVVAGSSSQQ